MGRTAKEPRLYGRTSQAFYAEAKRLIATRPADKIEYLLECAVDTENMHRVKRGMEVIR